ncbi:hypothetical protein CVS40_2564 [Lucilia cuprina]|nr:hypothetical protein CVS40_2564 [Lucilia cuprina]
MENVDVNYGVHINTRHQVLAKYSTALKQLRSFAERSYEIRPFAFDNYVLFQYFHRRTDASLAGSADTSSYLNISPMTFLKIELLNHILDRRRQILYWLFYLLLAVLCIFVYRHETSSSVAERSVRSMVYPSMRIWRRMTLPLIERFPRLTELYDESCLMGNPFFQVDDMSCSPCSHVKSVIDLTLAFENEDDANKNVEEHDRVTNFIHKIIPSEYVPFVFKISHGPIELQDVYNMYLRHQDIFERDAFRVHSTNRDVTNLEELFNQFNQTILAETHNLWRCNRMLPARLLRKLIARPSTLPSSLALERYMAIDTPQAQSYTLPDTECPHVYIQQALGTRFIILRPTSECRHRCRTLSIRLPQSFILSYNSWYWKPISAPDPVSDSISISLIGSYC